MLRGTFRFVINCHAETAVIKPFSEINMTDRKGKDFVARVIKINWVNMETGIICIDADYHEADMPLSEKKKKLFRVVG